MPINHTLNALNTLQACLANSELMCHVVKFYLSKMPELAEEAMGKAATVSVNVPNRVDNSGYGWRAASYVIPVEQLKSWAAICRSGRFVEAIKQCRADIGIGLKEAKDLVEYIREGNCNSVLGE